MVGKSHYPVREGKVMCPRSHSKCVAGLETEPNCPEAPYFGPLCFSQSGTQGNAYRPWELEGGKGGCVSNVLLYEFPACPSAEAPSHRTCCLTLSLICSNSRRKSVFCPRSQRSTLTASSFFPFEMRKRGELGMKQSRMIIVRTGTSPATASQRQESFRPAGSSGRMLKAGLPRK